MLKFFIKGIMAPFFKNKFFRTPAGKFVASLCAICGVLCITLPIPIIVANFNRYKLFKVLNI